VRAEGAVAPVEALQMPQETGGPGGVDCTCGGRSGTNRGHPHEGNRSQLPWSEAAARCEAPIAGVHRQRPLPERREEGSVLYLLVVLLIIGVVILLIRGFADARRAQRGRQTAAPSSRQPGARPRRAAPPVNQAALSAHVAALRAAIADGHVTVEDAVESVVRFTSGGLSGEAARSLLEAR